MQGFIQDLCSPSMLKMERAGAEVATRGEAFINLWFYFLSLNVMEWELLCSELTASSCHQQCHKHGTELLQLPKLQGTGRTRWENKEETDKEMIPWMLCVHTIPTVCSCRTGSQPQSHPLGSGTFGDTGFGAFLALLRSLCCSALIPAGICSAQSTTIPLRDSLPQGSMAEWSQWIQGWGILADHFF